MYEQIIWDLGGSIDNEIHYAGKAGAKGEKRAPRVKPTPEQMQRQNQWKKEVYMHRLIRLNFSKDDYLFTLKYPMGARPTLAQVIKDWQKFRDAMKRAYKKHDVPFKWIYRMEVGMSGGRHIHIIINHIEGVDVLKLVKQKWKPGNVNCQPMYEQGNFKALAEYMTKKPDKEIKGQLSLFETEEQKAFKKFSSSRNLKRPVPKKKKFLRRTVRKILAEGPQPRKGYYIDRESVVMGVNQFTGYSYIRYTEYALPQRRRYDETG